MSTTVTVQWREAPVLAAVRAGSDAGVMRAAESLLRIAKPRCPRDTGAMRESGRAELAGDAVAAVSFLRPGPDGAVITRRQHEDLTLRHTDGEAQWLARSTVEYSGRALADMADPIREELR